MKEGRCSASSPSCGVKAPGGLPVRSRVMLLLLLGVVSGGPLYAQARRPLRVWVAGGIGGAGGADNIGGVGALGQLTVQKAPHQVTLRGLFAMDPYNDGNSIGLGEFDLLYGRTLTASFGHAALSTGVGLVGFDICPGSYGPPCHTVGLPIVAEAAFQPFDILGVGVQGFANLNSRTSYVGTMLFLQLGWMP